LRSRPCRGGLTGLLHGPGLGRLARRPLHLLPLDVLRLPPEALAAAEAPGGLHILRDHRQREADGHDSHRQPRRPRPYDPLRTFHVFFNP
jgi:hypothetical protein